MKRLLSIVMVISLLCSFVYAVQAAEESTAETTEKSVAETEIELLRSLDIISGEYQPDQIVTRAQMADVAIKLANMNNVIIPAVGNQFTDVDNGHPYYNSIMTAYSMQYMNGCGDGLFEPDAGILAVHAKRVLMNILGYNREGAENAAEVRKLTKGVEQNLEEPATQKSIYIMAHNALLTPVLDSSYGEEPEYNVSDETLLEKVFSIKEAEGIVTADHRTSLTGLGEVPGGKIKIGDVLYSYVGADTMLGCRVKAYYVDDKNNEFNIIHMENQNYGELVLDGEDIESVKVADRIEIAYLNGEKEKTVETKEKPVVIYNGKYLSIDKVCAEDFDISSGNVTMIDNDSHKGYDVVVIRNGISVYTDGVSSSDNIVYFRYAVKFDGADVEKLSFSNAISNESLKLRTADNENAEFSDIKKECVLTIYKPHETDETIEAMIAQNTISGKINKMDHDEQEITIDDKVYKISKEYSEYLKKVSAKIKIGTEGTFALNENNRIVFSDAITGGEKIYGYLMGMYTEGLSRDVKMQVFTEKNKFETFSMKNKVRFVENGDSRGKVPAQEIYKSFFADPIIQYRTIPHVSTQFKNFPNGSTMSKDSFGEACFDCSENLIVEPMDGQHLDRIGIYAPKDTGWVTYKVTSQNTGGFDVLNLKYSGRGILTSQMRLFIGDSPEQLVRVEGEWPQELQTQNRSVDLTEYAQGKSEVYIKIELDNNQTNNAWAWLEDIDIIEKISMGTGGFETHEREVYNVQFKKFQGEAQVTQEMLGPECVEVKGTLKPQSQSMFFPDKMGVFAPNERAEILFRFESAGSLGFEDFILTYSGRALQDSKMELYVGKTPEELSAVPGEWPHGAQADGRRVDLSKYVRGLKEAYVKIAIDNTTTAKNNAWLGDLSVRETYLERLPPDPIPEEFDHKKMQLVRIQLNNDREVTLLETAKQVKRSQMLEEQLIDNDIFRAIGGNEKRNYYEYSRAFDGSTTNRVMISSSTMCFDVPGVPAETDKSVMMDQDAYNVRGWSARDGEYHIAVFDVDEMGVANVIVNYGIRGKRAEFDEARNYSVVKSVETHIDELDGIPVRRMTVYNASGKEEVLYEKYPGDGIFERKIDEQNYQFGDVIQLGNSDTEVAAVNTIFTTNGSDPRNGMTYTDPANQVPNTGGVMPAYGHQSSLLRIMTGVVEDTTSQYIMVNKGANFDEPETWFVAGGTPVIEVNMRNQTVRPISYNDINKGDFVVFRQQWSMVMQIIKYVG